VEAELGVAREAALKAVIAALDRENTPAAQRLKIEYGEALNQARLGRDPRSRPDNALRRNAVNVAREAIDDLRNAGAIGDEAYRQVEQELDLLELSSQPARE
jgi:CPA1 family monovalent cation:H+ antiporter